ncbi:MAG: hypothetical protein KGI37_10685, partial [Alphaproteobacteria bacterium]|nr:hypothetical protein [Alphaproteobacteria bacterium]
MNQKPPPAFTPFNKRDMITLAKMLGPLAFVLVIGIYFHEFVWHAVNSNIGINMGILSAASFGIFLILSRLIEAQEDFRIIERFGYEAKQG